MYCQNVDHDARIHSSLIFIFHQNRLTNINIHINPRWWTGNYFTGLHSKFMYTHFGAHANQLTDNIGEIRIMHSESSFMHQKPNIVSQTPDSEYTQRKIGL